MRIHLLMTELSPAARAVFDAHISHWTADPYEISPEALAAALRVVADQLQMDKPLGDTDADAGVFAAHHAIHAQILAIADELEGTQ
jgi:hypothetical protein